MTTMEDITNLCRTLSAARNALAQDVALAQAEIDAVKAAHLPGITARAKDVSEVFDALYEAVEANPGLFAKPKSLTLFGIKVGFAKGRGKIAWKDSDQVIALIKKHLPEQADLLIATREAPVKSALNGLPVADLRRIGVTVTEAGDRAIVIPQDGDLDRMVAAILGDPSTSAEASADRSTSDASEEEAA
jgi:hypothetical protein